jgi:hypothetical protein
MRLTEFQVAVDGDGTILGAIGLQVAVNNGLMQNDGGVATFDSFSCVSHFSWFNLRRQT